MDKEHISRDAFFAIYDFLDNDNGPRCLIDELDGFRYYFCSSSWIERATLDVFSNGVYLGEVDSNHRRHGIGVYVFNNGGIYLGEWSQGERDGRGFYGSPDKPGGLSIQLCKSEKKEFYIRYSS